MLDAADTGLRVMTEQRDEIEAEYANYYGPFEYP